VLPQVAKEMSLTASQVYALMASTRLKQKTRFVHIEYDGAHYNAYMQQNAGTKVFKYPRQISELPMVFETFVMQGLDTDQDDSLGCAHVFELQRRARRPDDGLLRCHVANNFYKCYLCWQSQARDKIFKQRLPTLLKGRIHPSLHPAAANKRHPRCWERLLCLYFKGVFGRWLPG
jgi:hypothetical protein